MTSSSRGPVAAATAVDAAGGGQGLAAVGAVRAIPDLDHGDRSGAGTGRHLGPVKLQATDGEGEGPNQVAKATDGDCQITQDGGEGASQVAKATDGDGETGQNEGEAPSQAMKVTEEEGKATEGEDHPSVQSSDIEQADKGKAIDKGKGPVIVEATGAEQVDKGKHPAIVLEAARTQRVGPVLWLGTGNLNRGKPSICAPTPDEEDDNVIIILQDSGRVSKVEFLKYNVVPDEIIVNRPLNARTAIENFFQSLHESTVVRRKMLHILLKGLTQGYSEGSKRLAELRDEISAAQVDIKKSCGKVLRKTPGYLMSDPVLLPK